MIDRYPAKIPGLPEKAITISNSTRKVAQCPRRFLLEEIEGLRSPQRRKAPTYGTLYHSVKEEVYRAWMRDEAPAWEDVQRALDQAAWVLGSEVGEENISRDDADEVFRRLDSGIRAWWRLTDGGRPPENYRVLGYEIALAMPIRSPSGHAYAPQMYAVPEGDGWRLARPAEHDRAIEVRWPWYLIGRLDLLMQDRRTGALLVKDDKTSSQPASRIASLSRDPQVPSYLSLVRHASREGLLSYVPVGTPVIGFWHAVSHSGGYSAPRVNKNGRLSHAKNQRCTSWDMLAAIEEHGHDPSEAPWTGLLDHLRCSVDAEVEQTSWQRYGEDDLDRHEREVYADAVKISAAWRAAVRAPTIEALDVSHPRVPVCMSPGAYCPVMGPCARDGEQVRTDYEVRPSQTWTADLIDPRPETGTTKENET